MKYLEQEEIVRLITSYLKGKTTPEEVKYLKTWVEASVANRTYYQQIKNIWEISIGTEDLSAISTDKALKKVLNKLSSKQQKHSIFFYWQRIAAVLLIPVLVGGYIWIRTLSAGVSSNVTYNEVYAAYGTRSAIRLADGSYVWLNSGSSLRYPDKFTKKQRVVYLTGEAYFEVKSDKSHPFIVQTHFLSVKATGTKFNVSAYKTEKENAITLIEGNVTVCKNKSAQNGEPTDLKPDQHIELDTLTGKILLDKNADVYQYIAWKDGKLVFRNEPLSLVVKKIGQYYNADIELLGKELREYRYHATFQEESLDEILKLLKISSPIKYKEIIREPLPDGSFPRKKVIISPRNE